MNSYFFKLVEWITSLFFMIEWIDDLGWWFVHCLFSWFDNWWLLLTDSWDMIEWVLVWCIDEQWSRSDSWILGMLFPLIIYRCKVTTFPKIWIISLHSKSYAPSSTLQFIRVLSCHTLHLSWPHTLLTTSPLFLCSGIHLFCAQSLS